MALYVLSYDLVNQCDYKPLWDELTQFEAVRVLESVWCFKRFNTDAAGLRSHFQKYIDLDDRLFVAEIADPQWAGYNLIKSPHDL